MWDNSSYTFTRPNIYKEEGVILARSAKIGRGSVIGASTEIGESTNIHSSVIGRNCIIGDNVTITNSYLWGDNVIEDNCTIDNSILCNGVILKQKTNIQSGCLLSFNCVVGPNITLEPETKITLRDMDSCDDIDCVTEEISLGDEGKGYLWSYDEGDPTNSLSIYIFLKLYNSI